MDWESIRDKAWYGVVKSTLQKHIRRGDVDGAAAMTEELWALQPAGYTSRMPIIVAEDALEGAGVLTRLGYDPIGTAREIARRPKNKDAGGVMWALYFQGNPPAMKEDDWFGVENRLSNLIAGGTSTALEACNLAMEMWQKRHKPEVIQAVGITPNTRVLLDRASKETRFEGEPKMLVVAATLVAAGVVKENASFSHCPRPTKPMTEVGHRVVPWYGCDMHTIPGKNAFHRLLTRGVVKPTETASEKEVLKTLWFRCGSSELGEMVQHNWWSPEHALKDEIGRTWAQGLEMWAAIKDQVREAVVYAAREVGIQAV